MGPKTIQCKIVLDADPIHAEGGIMSGLISIFWWMAMNSYIIFEGHEVIYY